MLKAIVVGNLGSDPELRYSAGGTATLRFNVASNGRTRNAAGEWQDTTEWIRVTVFGQRAEGLAPHLSRGMRVYCDGRLETRPWIDRTNEPRAGLELVADAVELAGSRQGADQAGQQPQRQARHPSTTAAGYATGTVDDLDGLPF